MDIKTLYRLKMIFSFAALMALLVAALELINWIPSVIETESLRKYRTIESLKRTLHVERIYMPSYLPEDLNLKWPPSEIYAQKKPFPMVIMHLDRRDSKEIGLVITQIDIKADYQPEARIKFSAIKKESNVMIKDREGTLITALCENDLPCNRISWREGDYRLTVTGKNSPRDMIRIARSMIPEN